MSLEVVLWGLGIVFSVIGYLLVQKDAAQGRQIDELWKKHDEDVSALQKLRLDIAEGHYKKVELDARFDKLEKTFQSGFSELGAKFDKFIETWSSRNGGN